MALSATQLTPGVHRAADAHGAKHETEAWNRSGFEEPLRPEEQREGAQSRSRDEVPQSRNDDVVVPPFVRALVLSGAELPEHLKNELEQQLNQELNY